MGWKPLTTIQLTENWQFSLPTDADHFRFNLTVPPTVVEPLRIDIAQSFFDNNQVDFFNEQSVEFDQENRILSLIKPYGLTERRIAVRRDTRFYASPPWLLSVDYFAYDDATQDLTNYLLERFQGLIPLFSETDLADAIAEKIMTYFDLKENEGIGTGCGDNIQLVPRRKVVDCTRNTPLLLIGSNKKRRSLDIKNYGDQKLVLAQSATTDESGVITEIDQRFEEIPAMKGFPFPSPNGCVYKGDVYALPKFDGRVEITEWVKEVISSDVDV